MGRRGQAPRRRAVALGALCSAAAFASASAVQFTCSTEIPVVRLRGRDEPALAGSMSIQEVVAGRRPVVLVGTPAESWAATGRWNEDFVRENLGSFPAEYRSSKRRVFTIRSESRTGETLRSHGDQVLDRVIQYKNGTIADVVDDEAFAYYSGPLPLSDELESQVEPNDVFSVVEPALRDKARSHTIIHIGKAGVTAQLHYDKSRNFLAQVSGTKRVIMFEPSRHWDLFVYPVTHPSRRQSQLNLFDDVLPEWARDVDLSSCVGSELSPGQVLYIPSFWWHQIEYTTFAISLSVVSPSIPEYLFSHIYWQQLAFSKDGTPRELVPEATRMYLRRVVPGYRRLIANLAETRFKPLAADFVEALHPSPEQSLPEECSAAKPEAAGECGVDRFRDAGRLAFINRTLDTAVASVQEILDRQLFANGFHVETEMLFADLVEELARSAVGVQNVYSFLRSFAQDP